MGSSSRKMLQAAAGNAGGGDFYPYTIENSCRFNAGDSPYLYRTLSGSISTWTLSFWIKRGVITSSSYQYLWSCTAGGSVDGFSIASTAGSTPDGIYVFNNSGGTITYTDGVQRDPSAFMHIVLSVNSNTVTVYKNNVVIGSGLSLNTLDTTTNAFTIGAYRSTGTRAFFTDGYMAEVAFIDGSALTPSSFGMAKNGIWIPKNLSGLTFGTDGFWLDFADSSNLGNDVSGNGNDLASTGLAANDQVPDTPTNTYPTMNVVESGSNMTYSNGNLSAVHSASSSWRTVKSTLALPTTGKFYWEGTFTNEAQYLIGVMKADINVARGTTNAPFSNPEYEGLAYYSNNGDILHNASSQGYGGATWSSGDVMGVAIDLDAQTITFYKNNSSQGAFDYSSIYSADTVLCPAFSLYRSGTVLDVDFGQLGFTYTPPTDHLALTTTNIPEPTIGPNSSIKPSNVFGVETYTGNGTAKGSGGNPIDLGVDMTSGDYMVAIKNRDAADEWMVFDTVRGDNKYLEFSSEDAEVTDTETCEFTSTGVTLGSNVAVNTNAEDYVLYWFKVTAGFFDIVSTEGTGVARTVAHSLGVIPNFIVGKAYDIGYEWVVYCSSLPVPDPETDFLRFGTNAAVDNNTLWNDTAPTSSVYSIGTDIWVNKNGSNFIYYLFADVEGFCKNFYYEGNGNVDGSFCNLGFLPDFLFIKRTDSTGSWCVYDTERSPYNETNAQLILQSTNAETTHADEIDINSNGVKQRSPDNPVNASGGDYIGIAIGVTQKYSNAR